MTFIKELLATEDPSLVPFSQLGYPISCQPAPKTWVIDRETNCYLVDATVFHDSRDNSEQLLFWYKDRPVWIGHYLPTKDYEWKAWDDLSDTELGEINSLIFQALLLLKTDGHKLHFDQIQLKALRKSDIAKLRELHDAESLKLLQQITPPGWKLIWDGELAKAVRKIVVIGILTFVGALVLRGLFNLS
jgi:hypothetical protein